MVNSHPGPQNCFEQNNFDFVLLFSQNFAIKKMLDSSACRENNEGADGRIDRGRKGDAL